jgi:hypothetical protein
MACRGTALLYLSMLKYHKADSVLLLLNLISVLSTHFQYKIISPLFIVLDMTDESEHVVITNL